MQAEIPFGRLRVGMNAAISKKFTAKGVEEFNAFFKDANPIHNDLAFSKKTVFGSIIVPGALLIALLSELASSRLPGLNYVYMSQKVRFLKPVKIGDTITAECECVKKIEEKKIAIFSTVCRNQSGETVMEETSTDKYIG